LRTVKGKKDGKIDRISQLKPLKKRSRLKLSYSKLQKKGRNSLRPNTPRIDPGDSFSRGIFVFHPVASGISN
jgi:hypothetical protein